MGRPQRGNATCARLVAAIIGPTARSAVGGGEAAPAMLEGDPNSWLMFAEMAKTKAAELITRHAAPR